MTNHKNEITGKKSQTPFQNPNLDDASITKDQGSRLLSPLPTIFLRTLTPAGQARRQSQSVVSRLPRSTVLVEIALKVSLSRCRVYVYCVTHVDCDWFCGVSKKYLPEEFGLIFYKRLWY
ncbi:hypothetical protein JTB14_015856 [Gonioctena quinquepunctata]|nr:hypothetical protein JTB14_015856 [Gonioctena quinquepunctata]